jgi:hypothetical protein
MIEDSEVRCARGEAVDTAASTTMVNPEVHPSKTIGLECRTRNVSPTSGSLQVHHGCVRHKRPQTPTDEQSDMDASDTAQLAPSADHSPDVAATRRCTHALMGVIGAGQESLKVER